MLLYDVTVATLGHFIYFIQFQQQHALGPVILGSAQLLNARIHNPAELHSNDINVEKEYSKDSDLIPIGHLMKCHGKTYVKRMILSVSDRGHI